VGSIADSNQHVYERRATVSYWTTDLSGPELAIFELYAADIDGKHVLDLGVGAGRTSPFLARRAQRYVGLDYSHRLVSVARKRFPSLDIRHGDARDLTQFGQHSFDFVLF
jgi:ubiquinone/menaquinone biosynthesis C-methylase UbiE